MPNIPDNIPRRNELLKMLERRLRAIEEDGEADPDIILLLNASIYNMVQVDVTSNYAENNARLLKEVRDGVEVAVNGIYAQIKADLYPSHKKETYQDFATKANGGRQHEIELKKLDIKGRMIDTVTSRGFIVILIVIYIIAQIFGIEIPVGDFVKGVG